MEYPFKDLMPLDEVLEREGYYKDWTHLDPKTFYSIVQISEMIKTKGYGADVRLLISQLAEHFGLSVVEVTDIANSLIDRQSAVENRQDAVEDFNTQVIQEMTDKDVISAPEIIQARGNFTLLKDRLDSEFNSVNAKTETISNLAESVSKVQKNLIQGNDILPINFKRISDQPSLTAFEIGESELAFPTVIKASEHIESPIDNYYLYIGPHDNSDVDYATGIHLLTSPTVTGPWTHYGVVITAAQLNSEYHAAALDVVWRADKGCYYGYAHGNEGYNNINPSVWTQRSYVLKSTDGINWTKVKTDAMVEPGTSWYADSAIDYARVFKFKGKWVALAQGQRVGDSNQKQGFYYSDDGIEWYADINNPIDASTFGKSWKWLFSSCAFPVGDTIYILMTVPNTDDTERSLWLAKTTNGSDIELVVDGPVFSKEPTHEWESGRVEYPHVYIENGEMYLFYISDISLIGKPRYMGIAKISLEG